ncbi:MAG: TetR/AcrR family transcriptional regulator [Hymenobacter sp.]|nr:MAG: TetR/AcrR family transcriptional regulator [Hymenobacter sp.]
MSAPAPDGRHRILAVAQRITFSRGLSALRMSDLADELGMSKNTLYAYYPSKEAMLVAMMDAHHHHYNTLFLAVLQDRASSFLDRLQQTMRLGWEINGEMSAEVMQDFQRHAPGLLYDFEQRKATAVQTYFRQLLAEGQRLGLLREPVSLPIVADILMNAITYHLTPGNLQGREYSVPEAFTTYYQLLFAGLLNETGSQQYLTTLEKA